MRQNEFRGKECLIKDTGETIDVMLYMKLITSDIKISLVTLKLIIYFFIFRKTLLHCRIEMTELVTNNFFL